MGLYQGSFFKPVRKFQWVAFFVIYAKLRDSKKEVKIPLNFKRR